MAEHSTRTTPVGSQASWRTGILALISVARPQMAQRRNLYLATVAMRVVSAGLLVGIGYIHYHLWQEGYKFIPTNGPLFLVDAITAIAAALAILVWARPLTGLLAAGFTVGTIGALVISLAVGLFGFKESIHASFVIESLILESITAVILAIWTLIAARAVLRQR